MDNRLLLVLLLSVSCRLPTSPSYHFPPTNCPPSSQPRAKLPVLTALTSPIASPTRFHSQSIPVLAMPNLARPSPSVFFPFVPKLVLRHNYTSNLNPPQSLSSHDRTTSSPYSHCPLSLAHSLSLYSRLGGYTTPQVFLSHLSRSVDNIRGKYSNYSSRRVQI